MRRISRSVGTILMICWTVWASETSTVGDDKTVPPTPPAANPAPTKAVPEPRPMGSTEIDPSTLQFPANFESNQKPDDAFSQLPSTTRITRLLAANADATAAMPASSASKQYQFSAVFDAPAQFPIPEFGLPTGDSGQAGQRIDRDGAIIEEGMLIQADSNGRYEIRFVVRTPRMPVALRMQLTLLKTEMVTVGLYDTKPITDDDLMTERPPKIKLAKTSRAVGTITLPAIYLKADRTEADTGEETVWRVEHRGYSRLLHQLLKDQNGFVNCRLLRRGTARFGETEYELLDRQ